MDAKEFELPLEGSLKNLISHCFQQQNKTAAEKVKKKQGRNIQSNKKNKNEKLPKSY